MKLKQVTKILKTKSSYFMTLIVSVLYSSAAYASETDLENTNLVKGTKDLLAALTGVLTGLVFVVVSALAIKQIIVITTATDQDKIGAKKTLWHIIGWGILGVCIPGVLTVIFAFYN